MGRGRLDHALAGPAGEGLAHVPHHLEAARNVVERLGHVLADPTQATAAGRAGAGTGMDDRLARQVIRQGPPGRLRPRDLDRLGHNRSRGQALGFVDLQRLDGEFELLDPAAQLLGRGTELGPLEAGKFEAQLLDQGVGLHGILSHADDHPLQRRDVIRQGGRIESHVRSLGRSSAASLCSSSRSGLLSHPVALSRRAVGGPCATAPASRSPPAASRAAPG
jgi:hypothetical protein